MTTKDLILLFIKQEELREQIQQLKPIHDEIVANYKRMYNALYNSEDDNIQELEDLKEQHNYNQTIHDYGFLNNQLIKNSIKLNNTFIVSMSKEDVDLIKNGRSREIDLTKY